MLPTIAREADAVVMSTPGELYPGVIATAAEGLALLADFAASLRLVEGQPFSSARLDADASTIEEIYHRRGFASVRAALAQLISSRNSPMTKRISTAALRQAPAVSGAHQLRGA